MILSYNSSLGPNFLFGPSNGKIESEIKKNNNKWNTAAKVDEQQQHQQHQQQLFGFMDFWGIFRDF